MTEKYSVSKNKNLNTSIYFQWLRCFNFMYSFNDIAYRSTWATLGIFFFFFFDIKSIIGRAKPTDKKCDSPLSPGWPLIPGWLTPGRPLAPSGPSVPKFPGWPFWPGIPGRPNWPGLPPAPFSPASPFLPGIPAVQANVKHLLLIWMNLECKKYFCYIC